MAKNKKQTKGERNVEVVEEALSKSEQFIEKNQNKIFWVVGIIVLIAATYIGYTRFVMEPREQNAKADIFMAEKYFEQDSLHLALYGDGAHYGFLDIIDNYRFTKTANLAKYYAGISYLRLGEYEEAIDYLKSHRSRDQVIGSMAYGAIGDAYLELGEDERAVRYYGRAVNYEPDILTTPIYLLRAAQVLESMGEYRDAVENYERIKEEYPESNEARDVERFIARAEARIN